MTQDTKSKERSVAIRYGALALLLVGVLLALLADGLLQTLGLVLGVGAVVAFAWTTLRSGPMPSPDIAPHWPAALAVVFIVLAVIQDPPQRWINAIFVMVWALIAAQAAVRDRTTSKVLDIVVVVALVGLLAAVAALL